jgi:hypothetical protein
MAAMRGERRSRNLARRLTPNDSQIRTLSIGPSAPGGVSR